MISSLLEGPPRSDYSDSEQGLLRGGAGVAFGGRLDGCQCLRVSGSQTGVGSPFFLLMTLAGPALSHLLSSQILQKVLQGCRENMLGTMALAACQFMEEPGMEVQVRESKHPYNNNTSFEVQLSIRNSYLPLLTNPD